MRYFEPRQDRRAQFVCSGGLTDPCKQGWPMAHLEALQKGQQGMTRVYGLETAQQICTIGLLAQVEGDELCADLSNTLVLSSDLSPDKRRTRYQHDSVDSGAGCGSEAMTQRIVVYIRNIRRQS